MQAVDPTPLSSGMFGLILLFALLASQRGPLARPPLAIPRGTQLRGPSGSLRCSSCRGYSQTRYAQTPRASFSRQLSATRPLRWDWGPSGVG